MAKNPTAKSKSSGKSGRSEASIQNEIREVEKKARLDAQLSRMEYKQQGVYPNFFPELEREIANPDFYRFGSISPYDAAAQYYGDQAGQEYAAAMEYAQRLAQTENPKANVDPSYYTKFAEQTPLNIGNYVPGYRPSTNTIQMPNLELFRQYLIEAGKDPKVVRESNFSSDALSEEQVNKNLMKYWKDTLEHEASHVTDKMVTYNVSKAQQDALGEKYGHLASESHIPVGLSKIQRERYSQTGKRFETPEQFKSFIFEVANSSDPEEKINQYSEEAKRALRVQIQNAKEILNQEKQQNYLDKVNAFEQEQENAFRKKQKQANLDFLEKSAQLIPALVQTGTKNKSSA